MFAGSGLQFKPPTQLAVPLLESDLYLFQNEVRDDFPDVPHLLSDGVPLANAVVGRPVDASKSLTKKTSSAKNKGGYSKTSSPQKLPHQQAAIGGIGALGDPLTSFQIASSTAAAGAETPLQDDFNSIISEEVRRAIAKSWKDLKEHEENCKNGLKGKKDNDEGSGSDNDLEAEQRAAAIVAIEQQSTSKGGLWSRMTGGKSKDTTNEGENGTSLKNQQAAGKKSNNSSTFEIPQTFKEMCILNAGMTGSNVKYIETVESCFEKLVVATERGDHARLQVEANIMALRMHKDCKGQLVLREFRTCMLASLRSLLPKSWSISLEQAWSAMWDVVQGMLTEALPLPGKYEKAVKGAVANMDEDEKKRFGLNAFNRMFKKQPKAENHFNTSNARLSVLASHSLKLSCDIYEEPTSLVDVVTSLGLKHIMYNISVEFFDTFVESMVEELECFVKDPEAVAGFEWALTQIAAIMIFTINEGQNPLLQAILTNKAPNVKKALGGISKKDRAGACVGKVTNW